MDPNPLGGHALAYARAGWEVLPLRGKVPAESGGHGVLDASCDLRVVERWWRRYPNANIGARVPAGVLVLDIDPRHGGLDAESARLDELRGTLTAWSGRRDGGRHHYFLHPGGAIASRNLPAGWDLKTPAGYTVLPSSLHPETGKPYRWDVPLMPIGTMPDWLVLMLRPVIAGRPVVRAIPRSDGDSIADRWTAEHSWHDVLTGWTCVTGDGDSDGSCWRHPTATGPVSATVRHGLLFVYSPNTPFDVTLSGEPHGYTRFRAWAVLEHGGDLSAAARTAAQERKAAR